MPKQRKLENRRQCATNETNFGSKLTWERCATDSSASAKDSYDIDSSDAPQTIDSAHPMPSCPPLPVEVFFTLTEIQKTFEFLKAIMHPLFVSGSQYTCPSIFCSNHFHFHRFRTGNAQHFPSFLTAHQASTGGKSSA